MGAATPNDEWNDGGGPGTIASATDMTVPECSKVA
jgi:hypothetical protein